MKKFLLGLIGVLTLFTVNVKAITLPEVTDHEKVTLYIFRGSGCSHCHEALTYLGENAYKYKDYMDIKVLEVWQNAENSNLYNVIADLKSIPEKDRGVPLILVGSSYNTAGFAGSMANEMMEAVLNEYQNPEYTDIVNPEIAKNPNVSVQTLEEACAEEGIRVRTSGGQYDGLIVLGIFAVVLGGLCYLVALSRRK